MQDDKAAEPDWDTPLQFTTTPALLIHALFATATTVHAGWSSCVDDALALSDLVSVDERTGNYCRLVEQEYMEEGSDELVWHDWAVELRVGDVTVTGHWQIQVNTSPMDWEWCTREAETAFGKACVLFGKRIRRGVGVEEPELNPHPPKQQRH
jgi:hypothetical protein